MFLAPKILKVKSEYDLMRAKLEESPAKQQQSYRKIITGDNFELNKEIKSHKQIS